MLAKLFLPHAHNNHKAKLRTSRGIIWLAILALIVPMAFRTNPNSSKILGYATAISDTEIVNLTNQQRLKNGVLPLKQDPQLNTAAYLKGQDMFKNQYWAHISPTGVQPWSFISQSGYVYAYAGENLARDFGDSESVVEAWMNSPTHRENIVNAHYKDIGVSVVNGILNGVETTLVIQEFGQKRSDISEIGSASKTANVTKDKNDASKSAETAVWAQTVPTPTTIFERIEDLQSSPPLIIGTSNAERISANSELRVSPVNLSQAWSVAIALVMIVVFALDWWLVSSRKLPRMVGKSWAHITVLFAVITALLSTQSGLIR